MVHNNSASSRAATNLTPVLNDEGKIGRSFIKLVAALEEAELLCTVVLDTGKGTIIPPQAPIPCICFGA
jgi:hypothetical protein